MRQLDLLQPRVGAIHSLSATESPRIFADLLGRFHVVSLVLFGFCLLVSLQDKHLFSASALLLPISICVLTLTYWFKGQHILAGNYHVRIANALDIKRCVQLFENWQHLSGWRTEELSRQDIECRLLQTMLQQELTVIGKPVEAFCTVDPHKNHVNALYCETQGLGLGKALMDKAKKGRRRLSVNVQTTNESARRFYEREGFRVKREFQPEDLRAVPEWRMEWRG